MWVAPTRYSEMQSDNKKKVKIYCTSYMLRSRRLRGVPASAPVGGPTSISNRKVKDWRERERERERRPRSDEGRPLFCPRLDSSTAACNEWGRPYSNFCKDVENFSFFLSALFFHPYNTYIFLYEESRVSFFFFFFSSEPPPYDERHVSLFWCRLRRIIFLQKGKILFQRVPTSPTVQSTSSSLSRSVVNTISDIVGYCAAGHRN